MKKAKRPRRLGPFNARCKVCGSRFNARNRTFCLCSDECRLEQKRRVCRFWYAAHQQYHIARVTARKKALRQKADA